MLQSRKGISGAAISIACGVAIFGASCIDLTVDSGSTGTTGSGGNGGAASGSSSSGPTMGSSSSSSSSSSGSGSASSGMPGNSSSSGDLPPICGDGLLESIEECDDGNVQPADGCGIDCKIEHPEVCPGPLIPLSKGQTIVIDATTAGASDKFVGSGNNIPNSNCSMGSWAGSDLIYQVVPSANGTLVAKLDATYQYIYLHARTACPGAGTDEVACHYTNSSVAQWSLPVTQDMTYYVAADSYMNKSGPFTLTLSLQ